MAKVIATGMRTDNKYARLVIDDSTNVIYNNSDSTKYREYTTSVKAYNSAFWHRSSNTQYLMTILVDRSDTLEYQTSSDNVTWTTSVSIPLNMLYNNVYSSGTSTTADGYYIINMALNSMSSLTSDIPIFENGSDYNNYMSNVYPWYTDFHTDLSISQDKRELLYQVLMNGIPSSITEAGAGSGYIGNSLLSNKKMVGYNVPTSSDAGTETESTNEYHSEGVTGKAKVGNGKVKITFLG